MATVTGYTAQRMKQIEDQAIVNGNVSGSNLMLTRHDGTQINAGSVIGPQGIQGPTGPTSIVPCLSTARPSGASLFAGLAIYETDTKRFYIWNGTAWDYRGGTFLCTSTTRPSSPFVGLEIYETDTKKTLVYNGVRYDPPWNYPWGIMGLVQRTTDAGPIVSGEATIGSMSVTITTVANRRVKVTFEGNTFLQSGSDLGSYIRIMQDATELMNGTTVLTTSWQASLHVEAYYTPTAGSHTYSVKAGISGSGSIMIMGRTTAPMSLLIEDMGPNGAPA